MDQTKINRLSRRRFLGSSIAAAALPAFIPSSVMGADGATPPSDRIVMGTIGIGGRGRYDMGAMMWNNDVQMIAVCDVQKRRREQAKDTVNKKYKNNDCKAFIDLNELLAISDINAVLIATGDNWHSMAAILAARAGKDMYCEKPLSVCIAESRQVAKTMRRYSRIFQCGTRSFDIAKPHAAFIPPERWCAFFALS